MESGRKPIRRVRFGAFEVNLEDYELRRNGLKVKLNEKPFQVLSLLLEKAGSVVRRDELRQRLWPADTYVDFDANLNTALSTLRRALNDSSENPIFVETIPRLGYRFVAPVIKMDEQGDQSLPPPASEPVAFVPISTVVPEKPANWRNRVLLCSATLAALVLIAIGIVLYFRSIRHSTEAKSASLKETILVTPFENMTGDPTQDYLSDGFTDEMITRLGEASPTHLSVIARSTAMQYKGTHKTVEQITREQKVNYVLEGCMRRQGDRIRITAQLFCEGASGSLWTEAYERNANDLMTIQREVADHIASSLSLTLFPTPANPWTEDAAGINPRAYDDYLKAVYQCRHLYANGPRAPLKFFQQAIDEQPSFARAYAELASCYQKEVRGGFLQPQQAYPSARTAAQNALQLDSSLDQAHLVLAIVRYQYEWDWKTAENEFQQAIRLNASSEWAHENYAVYLMLLGRFSDALAEAQKAKTLDPLSLEMASSVSSVYMEARDYDRAIQECRRILDIDPKFISAHYCIGVSEIYQGKYDSAMAELKLAQSLGDSILVAKAIAHATKGERQQALQVIELLKQHAKKTYISPYSFAEIYSHLGDKQMALQLVQACLSERCGDVIFLNIDPDFDNLRREPKFKELLTQIGFPNTPVTYPALRADVPTS